MVCSDDQVIESKVAGKFYSIIAVEHSPFDCISMNMAAICQLFRIWQGLEDTHLRNSLVQTSMT